MTVKKLKYAGMKGRFQPWHKGHQALLADMVARGVRPVLFLESCNADRDLEGNPLTFTERCRIIRAAASALSYPDGSKVRPVFVPLFDEPQKNSQKKSDPVQAFLEKHRIKSGDFTFFHAAKEEKKYPDIRKNFETIKKAMTAGSHTELLLIMESCRNKNAAYDGGDIDDSSYEADPFQVFRHRRRVLHNHLFKSPDDPSFHKKVLLIGADGALGLSVIYNMLVAGHDLVLASPRPADLEKRMTDLAGKFPRSKISHIHTDMRNPVTWTRQYWKDIYASHGISAVFDMAGIIEEKPEDGLTFENINYRPVPAMAAACTDCGIDRFIYFSTLTAGTEEARANASQSSGGRPLTYAGSKRKAEMALGEIAGGPDWFSIRPVTAYDPRTGNWGRDMTFPDLANLPAVPVYGSGNQLMQPLHAKDLGKICRLVESNQKGGQILNVVGPQQMKLKDILAALRNLKGEFPAVHIPHDRVLRIARHYPLGAINESFARVMANLEKPAPLVDPDPWAKAVGLRGRSGLRSLTATYNRASAGGVKYGDPPVGKYASIIASDPGVFFSLLEECGAQKPLMKALCKALALADKPACHPPAHAPGSLLVRRIIQTLGQNP